MPIPELPPGVPWWIRAIFDAVVAAGQEIIRVLKARKADADSGARDQRDAQARSDASAADAAGRKKEEIDALSDAEARRRGDRWGGGGPVA